MARSALTGTRIRERRTLLGLKQTELARAVDVSASYLNLIEHNRRRIGGKLLSEIARALQTDLTSLTEGAEAALIDQLGQAAGEARAAAAETARLDEFVSRFPGWAALVQEQHGRLQDLQLRLEGLNDRLSHDPRLASAMHEVLSKVTAIRSAAAILVETEDIDEAWRGRFQRNLHGDSLALAEHAQDLVTFLDAEAATNPDTPALEAATPWEEVELWLQRRGWDLSPYEARPGSPEARAQEALAAEPGFSPAGRAAAHSLLQRYLQEAQLWPGPALERYLQAYLAGAAPDPAAYGAQAGLPPGLILRRLALAPPAPGRDPLGFVLADGTGALLLRREAPGFLAPRAGQGCPLWPLYEAQIQPGRMVQRALRHSAAGGAAVEGLAVAEARYPLGADGPPLSETWMVILPERAPGREPLQVGSACRICAQMGCVGRREPSVLLPEGRG